MTLKDFVLDGKKRLQEKLSMYGFNGENLHGDFQTILKIKAILLCKTLKITRFLIPFLRQRSLINCVGRHNY